MSSINNTIHKRITNEISSLYSHFDEIHINKTTNETTIKVSKKEGHIQNIKFVIKNNYFPFGAPRTYIGEIPYQRFAQYKIPQFMNYEKKNCLCCHSSFHPSYWTVTTTLLDITLEIEDTAHFKNQVFLHYLCSQVVKQHCGDIKEILHTITDYIFQVTPEISKIRNPNKTYTYYFI